MGTDDVKKFISNATATLVKAKALCQDCYYRIHIVRVQFSNWQREISKMRFIIDCMREQGQFLVNGILNLGIGERLIRQIWGDDLLKNLVNEMRNWDSKITSQIKVLDSITNILLDDRRNNQNNNVKLGDYISRENVNILKDKLNEMPVIENHLVGIKSQYGEMKKKVDEDLVRGKLDTILNDYDDLFSSDAEELIDLKRTLDKLTSYEGNLVNILNSLTDHYDKCVLLELKSSSLKDYDDLYHIVKTDDGELSSVLMTLCEDIDEIDNIIEKFGKLMQEKTEQKISFHSRVNSIISEFKKYKEYLLIFKDISYIITAYQESCQQDIQIVKELYNFYLHFENSYHNLLEEVNRRRMVRADMQKVIMDCQSKLEAIDSNDRKKREKFLSENGNYLPETIWPDGTDDVTPTYTLKYTLRKI